MSLGALFLVAGFAALAAGAGFFVLRAYAGAGGSAKRGAVALVGVACLVAAGMYAFLGRPDLPGESYAARIEALKARPLESYTDQELLARLAAEAHAHPADPRPHAAMGVILFDQGRAEEAVRAFDAALRRDPGAPYVQLNLARALVASNQGRVTPEAVTLFAQVAQAEPQDPTPWLYQALAATQEGRGPDAARLWRETRSRLAANDPRRAMADRMIAESER